jgi:hypothetical protein
LSNTSTIQKAQNLEILAVQPLFPPLIMMIELRALHMLTAIDFDNQTGRKFRLRWIVCAIRARGVLEFG